MVTHITQSCCVSDSILNQGTGVFSSCGQNITVALEMNDHFLSYLLKTTA